jgi:hypothetical protein
MKEGAGRCWTSVYGWQAGCYNAGQSITDISNHESYVPPLHEDEREEVDTLRLEE